MDPQASPHGSTHGKRKATDDGDRSASKRPRLDVQVGRLEIGAAAGPAISEPTGATVKSLQEIGALLPRLQKAAKALPDEELQRRLDVWSHSCRRILSEDIRGRLRPDGVDLVQQLWISPDDVVTADSLRARLANQFNIRPTEVEVPIEAITYQLVALIRGVLAPYSGVAEASFPLLEQRLRDRIPFLQKDMLNRCQRYRIKASHELVTPETALSKLAELGPVAGDRFLETLKYESFSSCVSLAKLYFAVLHFTELSDIVIDLILPEEVVGAAPRSERDILDSTFFSVECPICNKVVRCRSNGNPLATGIDAELLFHHVARKHADIAKDAVANLTEAHERKTAGAALKLLTRS